LTKYHFRCFKINHQTADKISYYWWSMILSGSWNYRNIWFCVTLYMTCWYSSHVLAQHQCLHRLVSWLFTNEVLIQQLPSDMMSCQLLQHAGYYSRLRGMFQIAHVFHRSPTDALQQPWLTSKIIITHTHTYIPILKLWHYS